MSIKIQMGVDVLPIFPPACRKHAKDRESLNRKAPPQSASCSEGFLIPYEVNGQTLRKFGLDDQLFRD